MHAMHLILVDKPGCEVETDDEIIEYAENATDEYAGTVYDYRSTINIIDGAKQPDTLIRLVENTIKSQHDDANHCFQSLDGRISDFKNFLQIELNDFIDGEKYDFSLELCNLKRLLALIRGEYTFDSFIFDVFNHTSRISNQVLNDIREHPEKWALVCCDYRI